MTIWPKCKVCQQEIVARELFMMVDRDPQSRSISVAHEHCAKGNSAKVRRMNEARAWAVQEYSTAREDPRVRPR